MKYLISVFALLLCACAQAQDGHTDPAAAKGAAAVASADASYPPPIRALLKQGMVIKGSLPAPPGYHGYLGNVDGHPVPVYVPPDGKTAMVGTLFDTTGKDLTLAPLSAASVPTLDANTWAMLDKSTWVAEGAAKPKRIVYVFTDTECPYCHRLWQATQSRLEKNGVQVRNVIVAVIAPDSPTRGAAVLEAASPAAAFQQHEGSFGHSTLKPLADIAKATASKLEANNALMDALGVTGTPAVVYKDDKGAVRMQAGVPPPSQIDAIFGP